MSPKHGFDEDDVKVDVPHVRQKSSWDCGIACVQMVLMYFEKTFQDNFKEVCDEIKFGQSVWTIDIAYILHHYGIGFKYTTITLGVDKGYSSKNFYKEKFSSDEVRVNDLFEQSKNEGISVEKRSHDMQDITNFLSKRNIIIALVDWNHLKCAWCDISCLPTFSCVGRCFGTYQGHYIVVCGYNPKRKLIYYKNPSYSKELCCCSYDTFNSARKSYGTDEDLVFIECNRQAELKTCNDTNNGTTKDAQNSSQDNEVAGC